MSREYQATEGDDTLTVGHHEVGNLTLTITGHRSGGVMRLTPEIATGLRDALTHWLEEQAQIDE